jgi:DegV family protein with EDD domain
MQILTDRGMDLAPEQMEGLNLHFAPLSIHLEGKTYSSGIDLQPDAFYQMLSETEAFPTTSQPSAGEFAEIYREMARTDPDILSIHISSGLSGTINSAEAGAKMVPEANITIFDSKDALCSVGLAS